MSASHLRAPGSGRLRCRLLSVVVALLASACHGAAPRTAAPAVVSPVRLHFEPESPRFAEAARAYDSLWVHEGTRMVAALEAAAKRRFSALGDTSIRVIVFEGVSYSGDRVSPMRMRASYPLDTRRSALMHELGHRLGVGVFPPNENEHMTLFLWLFEAWEQAYGTTFAHAEVAIEKRRGGIYPIAWDAALALSPAARAARWDSIRAARR